MTGRYATGTDVPADRSRADIERVLLLNIKAKLEAVEVGLATFEEEFLARIVLPDNRTVGQAMVPQIEKAYTDRTMPTLMPALGAGNG